MVEPPWLRRIARIVALGCVGPAPGCAVVPRSRLDECHNLSRTLQAENSRLKDSLVSLQSRNQDLVERASDDGRRLQVLREANERLERSVLAYQDERERLARAFERLKYQFQNAMSARISSRTLAEPLPESLLAGLRRFAEDHPGCTFDPALQLSTFASGRLFDPGTDRLHSEGRAWLASYAQLLRDPEARAVGLRVIGRTEASPVERAGMHAEGPEHRRLSLDRANRVRDVLVAAAGIDPARIDVAGDEELGAASPGPSRRIEIHLRRLDRPTAPPTPRTATGPSGP